MSKPILAILLATFSLLSFNGEELGGWRTLAKKRIEDAALTANR